MARKEDEALAGLVAVLLIALIVIAVWFYFKVRGTDPLSEMGKAMAALWAAVSSSVENLMAGSFNTPVSTWGSGGGSDGGAQVLTGSSSSEAGLGLTPIVGD